MKPYDMGRAIALLSTFLGLMMAAPAAEASGTLLVLNKGSLRLVTVDPATLTVTGSYPSGPDPHEVVASDDGSTAYITNYTTGGTITVIDLAGRKALTPIDLGALKRPHGLAFAGGKVYFTAEGSKAIGRYDPVTAKIDWIMGTAQDRTHMITVSNDLKHIVTANPASGTVSFIEQVETPDFARPPPAPPMSDWKVTSVPVGRGAEGHDRSPDGQELWVLNAQDATITILDLNQETVLATVPVPLNSGNRLKFTPDGKFVITSDSFGPDVVVFDAKTRKAIKRIDTGAGAGLSKMAGVLIDPDGSRAFVAVGAKGFVAVIDLKTMAMTGKIETGIEPDGLGWAATKP